MRGVDALTIVWSEQVEQVIYTHLVDVDRLTSQKKRSQLANEMYTAKVEGGQTKAINSRLLSMLLPDENDEGTIFISTAEMGGAPFLKQGMTPGVGLVIGASFDETLTGRDMVTGDEVVTHKKRNKSIGFIRPDDIPADYTADGWLTSIGMLAKEIEKATRIEIQYVPAEVEASELDEIADEL